MISSNCKNPKNLGIRERLGAFIYDYVPQEDGAARIWKDWFTTAKGNKYYGQWNEQSNQMDGKGIYIFKSGAFYEGYWRKDKWNGRGRHVDENGVIYDGEWKDGKKNGKGKITCRLNCFIY